MSLRSYTKGLLKRFPTVWLPVRRFIRTWRGLNEPEMELLPLLVDRGRCAVDVGANVGIYTDRLIRLASRVVAIEANPALSDELQVNFRGRAQIISCGVSDREGTATLFLPRDRALSGIATLHTTNPLTSQDHIEIEIPTTTIDNLEISDVGFIKIDVEGHEEEVIEGARATILRDRPTLLIEIEERHSHNSVNRIVDLLSDLGYSAFFINNGRLLHFSYFDHQKHQSPGDVSIVTKTHRRPVSYINNFIFLPINYSKFKIFD